MVTRLAILLLGLVLLSACGGSANLSAAQNNKSVQQTATKVEKQVSNCLPTTGGVPNPLLLGRSSVRAKFATCMGVVKNGRAFEKCAVKVILGGIPTATRVKKGLATCAEQAA
ncbi:MAG TPA: hypothetical protein VIX82_06105 [Solirubrobacteraceae bacterium]